MDESVSVSAARASLPRIVERVAAGEEVTLTRHGEPVAVVVRPDTLRARRADRALTAAGQVQELIEQGGSRSLDGPGLDADLADALVAEIRRDRSAR